MLFKKSLHEIEYNDIRKLMDDEIDESEILDYKTELLNVPKHENILLKEVAAFSNTSGGFLIYGVEEDGKGGHPIAIDGIDDFNTERLEQIIISNIIPRIGIFIKPIVIPEKPSKIVLIIHVPEGQNQPYYDNRSNKFYKRYNFEAKEMDEHEIEALYQKRFFGSGKLSKYIDNTIFSYHNLMPIDDAARVDSHIVITPLKVDEKLINSHNMTKLNFDLNETRFEPRPNGLYLETVGKPSRYGIRWKDVYGSNDVEIHRNGL